MASKKKPCNYWYVLVMTDEGPRFVTGIGDHHTAFWNVNEKPKELGEIWAKDIAKGLLMNWFNAFAVFSPIEIDQHPYNYKQWHIEWKENKQEVEE